MTKLPGAKSLYIGLFFSLDVPATDRRPLPDETQICPVRPCRPADEVGLQLCYAEVLCRLWAQLLSSAERKNSLHEVLLDPRVSDFVFWS